MTIYSLTFRAEHFEALQSHLIREDGLERAAYLLCRKARSENDPWERQVHEKFLVTEVIPVPGDDVIESTSTSVSWRTRSFVRALKDAEARDQVVAVVHNHPAGYEKFSPQDNANEPDLLQGALNRNGPGTRMLSLLLTPDDRVTGRVWLHPSETGHTPLSMIRVIGSRIALYYPERRTALDMRAFHRQALAFGQALNRDLRKLRVGIVGCGGTGSAVALLLARLGVGQLVVFDNDIVDQTNLNRLHGARQADADAMRPKVEVVSREISELGLGIRVVPVNAWVGDPICRDALKSCDVIFGCTDDHDGRLLLNRFAYYYLTLKRKNPAEFEKRKAEAYVFGEGDPSPAVVTFTTELACMGVNELLHRLQGFRGPEGHAPNRVRRFHLNEDRRPGRSPQAYCPLCASKEAWGAGDVEPFLDRVE
jgi:hypothetical protein